MNKKQTKHVITRREISPAQIDYTEKLKWLNFWEILVEVHPVQDIGVYTLSKSRH